MRTKADELRDNAKKHIRDAIICLTEMVVDRCDGMDEYRQDYQDKLKECLNELISVKHMLI